MKAKKRKKASARDGTAMVRAFDAHHLEVRLSRIVDGRLVHIFRGRAVASHIEVTLNGPKMTLDVEPFMSASELASWRKGSP